MRTGYENFFSSKIVLSTLALYTELAFQWGQLGPDQGSTAGKKAPFYLSPTLS